ncbi:DUF6444 domain-containing protein [Nocardiopsis exhalans]|uniref:DUF6444 domain-containing protein n=1 Tax=Nocardiopsis exhalans TaxID=163604 RepID=A0ABY5DDU0_9ACTN|nr:DUF6444 domain-containing protein [Nocardiopsis exhalans]USY22501.1 DUF6444 domain-containing protein [Nocardiopsis exhalans]
MTSSDQPAPSYEELAALVVEQAATITQLRADLSQANERIAELQARLDSDSTNSSKPSSTDPFVKPKPKSQRRRTGRKPGGQPGHPGQTRAQTPDPDHVLEHHPHTCGGCGGDLAGSEQTGLVRRQVVDLPPSNPR